MSSDVNGGKVAGAELLAAALQTVAQPVWVVDRDGVIRFANAAAIAALGYSGAEELIGRDSHQTIHHHRPDGRPYPAGECPMLRPRTTGRTVSSELDWFFRRDGSMFRVSYVSAPLEMADGRGAVVAFTELDPRLRAEEALREREASLAAEQAALRRVATLVAGGIGPEHVFRAVADEVKALVGADMSAIVRFDAGGTVVVTGHLGPRHAAGARAELDPGDLVASVRETGQAAWFETDDPTATDIPEPARAPGIRSGLAGPIVVDGELWGAITVASVDRPLAAGTEQRLADFAELMAAAISNAQAREDHGRLADEQAALRRAATLVAREASHAEVFTALAEAVGQLLDAEDVRIYRYEHDDSAVVVAASGHEDFRAVGSRHLLGGTNSASLVFRTGGPVRIDDYGTVASGSIGDEARSSGIRSVAAAPILVEGRLWGAIAAGTGRVERLPPDAEARLGQFTELMATAIANIEAHATADRLAEEQAALRRVATLVAKESAPAEMFAKVAQEAASVLGNDCGLLRDEGDGTASIVAAWGAGMSAGFPVGMRLPVDGDGVLASVVRDGRTRRIDDYSAASREIAEGAGERGIRSAVGCPIVVRGRVWGAMVVARYDAEPMATETETRLAQFADLVATAIANAEARAEVERLADEQAALRRVAMLVAGGASAAAVFDAVAAEMERVLDADGVTVSRYEPGGEVTLLAHRGSNASRVPPGTRVRPEAGSVTATVWRTERPARVEHYEREHGAIARLVEILGVRTAVGAPIVVEGRLWGTVIANWRGDESPPADTEARMAQFAQLLDTAIANADASDQLTASRARLLTAGDEARRRVVRDLHDGAQQRLVHTIVMLKLAQRALGENDEKAESLLRDALEQAEQGNAALRELAHGILPAVLTRGGLRAGVDAVVARLDLPVRVDVPAERFPAEIEASAYFVVAEALTNVVKHARAEHAQITASVDDRTLHVEVRDDGIGGADPDGHGLIGMGDRVNALGGRLEVESPAGGGTVVTATMPIRAGE